jgi:alkyl-hydroperoxide reductase/thiol specific antioxidant family protein
MDLRTFLRPEPVPLQPIPAIGAPAPATPKLIVATGRPTIIAFLRHVGCPFAEATFHRLAPLSQAYPDVDFVAVSHATAAATASWCGTLGGAERVRIVVDTDRTLYAAWGLGLTDARHFLGARSLASVARLAANGIRNRHPSGTRWQTAGTFALDAAGIVRWRHIPAHAGDLPDLDAARSFLT